MFAAASAGPDASVVQSDRAGEFQLPFIAGAGDLPADEVQRSPGELATDFTLLAPPSERSRLQKKPSA